MNEKKLFSAIPRIRIGSFLVINNMTCLKGEEMKNKIIFFLLSVFLCTVIHSAVYVKGNLHFEPFYDSGVQQSADDAVYEWWFEKNRVSFLAPRWRFTLDRDKNQLIAVNSNEKFYVEIPLPMKLEAHVSSELAENLKQYGIEGTIKKSEEKKICLKKTCETYLVSESIVFQGQSFYERERTVLATLDVSFDWKLLNELYGLIRSFFKPGEAYQNELKQIAGFVMASEDVRFQEGIQVKYNLRVLEIIEKAAPESVFDIPEGFKKRDAFTRSELIDIRTTYYFYYR
jgi:hypothetical protein